MRAWLAAVCVVTACGGGGAGTGDDDQVDAAVDAPADGAVTPAWTSLLERTWQIQPAAEQYRCVRKRIDVDTYVSGFHLSSTDGIYFAMLTIVRSGGAPTPNGAYDCSSADVDDEMIFAGGVGTDDVVFPKGVAIKLPAGSYIKLNLQLLNPSTTSYTNGKSRIDVLTTPAADVVHEADMMFLGTFDVRVPPTNQPYQELGSCGITGDWTVVGLWPRMKRYATRQTVTVRRAGTQIDTPVLDVPFSFDEQKNYPMQTVLHPNDQFTVACTYVNNTKITDPPSGYEVEYGENTNKLSEMCFTGFYKWPATHQQKYACAPL